ncbi:protein cortex-like [Zootermopsis nevadensis]|uniref:Cell division cycle protein 20-like protein n=1 Tax=Zootermopsis nevadensis TaxID=136037 RepID=A0A067QYG4_ZOONE|nr:protein cortex-like [Zootermopsis nevadensis]KDR14508.1 Cell division cycle protein 20-like protein [Zootermopsis nevadensis]
MFNMPLQSFTSKHEWHVPNCLSGDRFIPLRCLLNTENFRYAKALSQTQQEEDILKQDITSVCLEEYRKNLQFALNLGTPHSRLLRFSCSSPSTELPLKQAYHWPVRCRKRPLIKQPHHLLDLPNFRYNFFLNLLDWGPSKYLAAALYNSVYLYANGENTIELTAFTGSYCSAVKWDSNGETLIVGTNNSVIQVWNTESRKLLEETVCNCTSTLSISCAINALAWHPSNTLFVSGCSTGTLLLIPLSSFQLECEQISILRAHKGQISSLRCSPDGRFLASSGEDSAVRLWHWPHLTPGMEITSFDDPVRTMAWHPWKPSYLVIGGSISGSITLWNVNKYTQEARKTLDSSAVLCSLEWSPITGELVAGIWVPGEQGLLGRSVLVVLATLNKVVDRLDYYAGQIYYLLWSPDGKQIATVGSDETLRIWYFLGPSSAREKDIWRFLKPVVPATFSMSLCNKRKKVGESCHASTNDKGKRSSFKKEDVFSIHNNSFGCVIR